MTGITIHPIEKNMQPLKVYGGRFPGLSERIQDVVATAFSLDVQDGFLVSGVDNNAIHRIRVSLNKNLPILGIKCKITKTADDTIQILRTG